MSPALQADSVPSEPPGPHRRCLLNALTQGRPLGSACLTSPILAHLSLPDIGKEFAKDHSTVLYNIRKVEVALKNGDENMKNNIRDITANINSCL